MIKSRWRWLVPGTLMFGVGIGQGVVAGDPGDEPPALEGPATGGEFLPPPPPRPAIAGPTHEAFLEQRTGEGAIRAPKSPPPPVAERPTEDRPSPGARWVAGYWTWVPARRDFAWVTGTWGVPPGDMIWINGRWLRDDRGWTRTPGFWSPRHDQNAARAAALATTTDWRSTGPPSEHPLDEPGPSPDANAFYVPGHYQPDGDRLTWVDGFWSRVQPGWDWVPSRWVRRPDAWEYREGYWTRDRGPDRHEVARPRMRDDLPPAILDSEPKGPGLENVDRLPPPGDRDLLAPPPRVAPYPGVVVVPPPGYYYRRLPGPYYDPLNVTPPFVRRLLDRVMP